MNDPRQPPPQTIVVQSGGGASGVFWGLMLFFVGLPLAIFFGMLLMCSGCVGGCQSVVEEAREAAREAEAERARREATDDAEQAPAEEATGPDGDALPADPPLETDESTAESPPAEEETTNPPEDPSDSADSEVESEGRTPEKALPSSAPVEPDTTVDSPQPPRSRPNRNELRTWTSEDGRFTVEGRFGGLLSGQVRIKKPDGETISVEMEKLSPEDQAWVQAILEAAGN